MEILIGASVGLFTRDGQHILRIITDDKYNFYDLVISPKLAHEISEAENLEISKDPDH